MISVRDIPGSSLLQRWDTIQWKRLARTIPVLQEFVAMQLSPVEHQSASSSRQIAIQNVP
jgi:hypothetical protein